MAGGLCVAHILFMRVKIKIIFGANRNEEVILIFFFVVGNNISVF